MATVAEILSSCGKRGDRIYSAPWGYVQLASVVMGSDDCYHIKLDCGNGNVRWLDGDGRLASDGECLIWPSYKCRDWEAWYKERATSPGLKVGDFVDYCNMQWFVDAVEGTGVDAVEGTGRIGLRSVVGNKDVILYQTSRDKITKADKFDPSQLQPYDRVLIRYSSTDKWRPDFWGYRRDDGLHCCTGGTTIEVVPYNDITKHLIGTADNAPDFYNLTGNRL